MVRCERGGARRGLATGWALYLSALGATWAVSGTEAKAQEGLMAKRSYHEAGFMPLGHQVMMRVGSHSVVEVLRLPQRRGYEIQVVEGSAYFSGTPDEGRGLRIVSGSTLIRGARGEFDVRHVGQQTRVTVSSGAVQLEPCGSLQNGPLPIRPTSLGEEGSEAVIALRQDQSYLAPDGDCRTSRAHQTGRSRPTVKDLRSGAMTWLDRARTEEVLDGLNRQHPNLLFAAEPGVDDLQVSGPFRFSAPTHLLFFLERVYGVRAVSGAAPAGYRLIRLRLPRPGPGR